MRPNPNKGNKPGMISADAMRRIGRVVAAYERGDRDRRPQTRTVFDDGDPVRICKTTSDWNKNTTATLDVWESGTPPDETKSTGQTLDAINKTRKVVEGSFVIVARGATGKWYLVEPEVKDPGECAAPNIAGQDLTSLPGYSAGNTQALIHESGCLKWIDIEDCPTETPA